MTHAESHSSVRLKHGVVFTPDGRREADVYVEEGRIVAIGDVDRPAERTIDVEGNWIFPGLVDAHVHFRDPGFPDKEDWSTGSAAAVAGGVTTVFDMPNTQPSTTTPEALADKRERADRRSRCHFGLFFGATPENPETYDRVSGVPGIKIYMGTSTGELLVDDTDDLERVFAHWEGQISVHAEDQSRLEARAETVGETNDVSVHSEIRDPTAAAIAVRRATRLAAEYERDLHIVHLSTPEELEALSRARRHIRTEDLSAELTAEVCPHHLLMDTGAYTELGTRAKVNPPLRRPEAPDAMWEALREGRIQFVATDHAPHTPEQKDQPYSRAPSGLPGVQLMLSLMLDARARGKCGAEDIVEWLATEPARCYGLADRGVLREGAHADITVVDPDLTREVRPDDIFSRCGWTPWDGHELQGWPVLTLVGGQLAYRRADGGSGEVIAPPGTGEAADFSG